MKAVLAGYPHCPQSAGGQSLLPPNPSGSPEPGGVAAHTFPSPLSLSSRIPFKIGQPKKQIVPKTVERDFEREYGKLQQLEDQTKKLQKDMKKSTDADLAMSKSAVKISSDLLSNPLCEQEPGFLEMVTAFDTAMKRMDSFNQEKVNQIQKTVIEPLKKFSSVFPSLNMAVKRREQTLQDYKRLQSKVEKYEEKERTGPVLAKLHQAREELRPVKEDFEAKNKQLLEEMPKFYSSRIDYFKPSFESLVRAQVRGCSCLLGTARGESFGGNPPAERLGGDSTWSKVLSRSSASRNSITPVGGHGEQWDGWWEFRWTLAWHKWCSAG
ncbi:PREDICTED: bridging integrator 3 [Lepidothrix coronata]|uniref:Bridging integrator 3 n=1 Tax=Lepidothrix coronata TaxID=321398 RepID=A0A6J0I7Z2_9PASS|nr:PREDICTED: bridging integrator 3 [Lepidothrix coronata]